MASASSAGALSMGLWGPDTPEASDVQIGLGQRLGEVTEIMGLAKLIATLGKDRSARWHQTRLFITEHRQNRPLELLERSEEGLESGLILLGKPAAA